MRSIVATLLWALAATTAASTHGEGLAAFQRGDFNSARQVIEPLAESGDSDSQNLLGRMYAQGDGVLQDYIEAYKWLNLAAARGNRAARTERDQVAQRMTPAQIAQAQQAARSWQPKARQASSRNPVPRGNATPGNSGNVIKDVQAMLEELGYEPGPADGVMGRRTSSAIRTYQLHSDLAIDGQATSSLRKALAMDLGYETPSDDPVAAATQTPSPRVTAAPTPAANTQAPSAQANWTVNKAPIYARLARPANSNLAATGAATSPAIAELKRLIKEADNNRRADRRVLEDLRGLVRQYDSAWQRLLVEDAFRDGNFTRNPAWRVIAGEFWIGRGEGLRTQVLPPRTASNQASNGQQLGIALLGALLGQQSQSRGQDRPSKAAVIALPRSISGSFALELTLLSGTRSGAVEFGVYRGENGDRSLRLIYHPGAQKSLQLVRLRGSERQELAAHNQTLNLEDNRSHTVLWTRDSSGQMVIKLDGKQLLRVAGRQNRRRNRNFDGFFMTNSGGNYGLQSVRIFGG